jgi:ParB family chromosome partitioning protein
MQRDPEAIKRLRDQIATSGLINPITVRPAGERFRLIAGLNRLEAYKLLQRTEIPAHVVNTNDTGASTIRLTENLTRTNLTPVEEAAQLHDLVEATPGGVDVVAATIGRTVNWILDRLEILDWDVELQQAVHAKHISAAAAKRLARIVDPLSRQNYVHQAAVHGISARTAALWLQDANALSQPPPLASENSYIDPPAQSPPETRIQCFTCGAKYNIQDTHPVRLCSTCIQHIQAACLRGPPQENTST